MLLNAHLWQVCTGRIQSSLLSQLIDLRARNADIRLNTCVRFQRKNPQAAPCCRCHLPPECEGHIICCCHSQRDVTVCKIKAAGASLGHETGSLSREGKEHRLLKISQREHLQRWGGEQLSFLQRKCAVEPTGGRFGLSLALIDWGHEVLRHTRKFGVTKLWIQWKRGSGADYAVTIFILLSSDDFLFIKKMISWCWSTVTFDTCNARFLLTVWNNGCIQNWTQLLLFLLNKHFSSKWLSTSVGVLFSQLLM